MHRAVAHGWGRPADPGNTCRPGSTRLTSATGTPSQRRTRSATASMSGSGAAVNPMRAKAAVRPGSASAAASACCSGVAPAAPDTPVIGSPTHVLLDDPASAGSTAGEAIVPSVRNARPLSRRYGRRRAHPSGRARPSGLHRGDGPARFGDRGSIRCPRSTTPRCCSGCAPVTGHVRWWRSTTTAARSGRPGGTCGDRSLVVAPDGAPVPETRRRGGARRTRPGVSVVACSTPSRPAPPSAATTGWPSTSTSATPPPASTAASGFVVAGKGRGPLGVAMVRELR